MKAKTLAPNLVVNSVNETVKFYTQTLEFNYVMGVDNDKQLYLEFDEAAPLGFAIVQNGKVQVMMQEITNIQNDGFASLQTDISKSNIVLYFEVEELDAYYEKLTESVEVVHEMRNTFYGMKEFYIKDNNGNILGFAEKLV